MFIRWKRIFLCQNVSNDFEKLGQKQILKIKAVHISHNTKLCTENICPEVTRPELNTLRPEQNGSRLAEDILKLIFLSENCCILIHISPKFVSCGPIDHGQALVQTMIWHRIGTQPIWTIDGLVYSGIYESLGSNEFLPRMLSIFIIPYDGILRTETQIWLQNLF